jgi:hypothetical protein
MALSDKERRLLVRARELLRSEMQDFICYALAQADGEMSPQGQCLNHHERLVDFVLEQISPCLYLHAWQMHHHMFIDHNKARTDRIAWIDWMLDEPMETKIGTESDRTETA